MNHLSRAHSYLRSEGLEPLVYIPFWCRAPQGRICNSFSCTSFLSDSKSIIIKPPKNLIQPIYEIIFALFNAILTTLRAKADWTNRGCVLPRTDASSTHTYRHWGGSVRRRGRYTQDSNHLQIVQAENSTLVGQRMRIAPPSAIVIMILQHLEKNTRDAVLLFRLKIFLPCNVLTIHMYAFVLNY